MISLSSQQEVAYAILTFLVLVLISCLLYMIYYLLVHLFYRNDPEDETENITIVIQSN